MDEDWIGNPANPKVDPYSICQPAIKNMVELIRLGDFPDSMQNREIGNSSAIAPQASTYLLGNHAVGLALTMYCIKKPRRELISQFNYPLDYPNLSFLPCVLLHLPLH